MGLQTTGGGGITNGAGANILTKSNGTNLVASRVTDDGTDIVADSGTGKVQIKADDLIEFYVGGARKAYLWATGGFWSFSYAIMPAAANTHDVGGTGSEWASGYFGTKVVTPKLNLSATVTPSGTADAQGSTGDVRYDDSFVYVKTSAGWKRSALSTF